MSRIQKRVVAIRLNDEALDGLSNFAIQHNMINKSGEPNISMAARTLLFMALRNTSSEGIMDVHLDHARAQWLEMVNGAWRVAMKELSRIGLEE